MDEDLNPIEQRILLETAKSAKEELTDLDSGRIGSSGLAGYFDSRANAQPDRSTD